MFFEYDLHFYRLLCAIAGSLVRIESVKYTVGNTVLTMCTRLRFSGVDPLLLAVAHVHGNNTTRWASCRFTGHVVQYYYCGLYGWTGGKTTN